MTRPSGGGSRQPRGGTAPARGATRPGVSVVVLAGGRSSRFGGPKLEAELDGRRLLAHVIELARALSDDVMVALRPGDPTTSTGEAALDSGPGSAVSGVRTIADPEPFGGPLVGLASALELVDRAFTIVLAGDMPRVPVAVLQPMLIILGQADRHDAVVLERDGQPRPLPLALRTDAARTAIETILAADGERSLRALVAAVRNHVLREADWRPLDVAGEAMADVDRPDDLAALEHRTNRGRTGNSD